MRIGKLSGIASLLGAPMALIATSLILVTAFSRTVDVGERDRRPPADSGPSAAIHSPRPALEGEQARDRAEAQESAASPTIDQPAIVEPSQRVEIVSDVSGRITRLAVDIGACVRCGDVLAEIEAPERKLDLDRAEAVVRQARARISSARSDVLVAEADVHAARARMASAEAAWRAAQATQAYRQRQHARIVQLVEKGTVSPGVRQEEEDRLHAKESDVSACRSQLTVAQADHATAAARLQSARSKLEEIGEGLHIAEAERDKARLIVGALRIRSPIDGIVTHRNVDIGAFVRAAADGGSTPILTVVQTRVVRVVTHVPDRDVARVQIGDPVAFRPDALGGRDFRGKVTRFAVAEDPSTRTMRAEIDLDNADGFLRPGQCGRVQIEFDARPRANLPPSRGAGESSRAMLSPSHRW